MHDHLARRLQREALASRPAPSPTLLHRVRAGITAESAGRAGAPRPPAGPWLVIQACAVVVVLAIVTIVATRSPFTPTVGDSEPESRVNSVPAAVAPPIEELVADLRTDLQGMAAALIGLPEWNEVVDLDASLAFMAEPSADRP